MRFAFMLAAVVTAAPLAAQQQSPFNGTWLMDPSTMRSDGKPETWSVRNGRYDCETCIPAIHVAADGAFHKVAGHPYWDEIKVDASASDKVAYSYRRRGKLIATSTDTVSADGATLSSANWSISNAQAKPIEATGTMTRVGPVPAGAHATSGSWKREAVALKTAGVNRLTFDVTGDTVTISEATGESVTGKIDGPFAPNKGDVGGTMYAYRMPAPNVIEETSQRNGEPVGVSRFTVSPDGRTLTSFWTDKRDGRTVTITGTKE